MLSDISGKASVPLNKNEIFIYVVYKLGYEEKTGNFFTNSNKDISLILEEIPKNHWFSYYENNGEIEVKFNSLNADTNYNSSEYLNSVLEIKNVAGENIELMQDKTSFKTVDSETLRKLRWWGDLKPYEILVDLTLKKDGWVKVTLKDDEFEVCVGNAIGGYKGQPFDLSGSEFICKKESNQANLIPEWILKGWYKLQMEITYEISGQEKLFGLLTQEFFIDNLDWRPEIDSAPDINLIADEEWLYSITPKYPSNFVYYSLEESPAGMKIDSKTGIASWTPRNNGNYSVVIRAYYPYFYDNYRIVYTDQPFTLIVSGGQENENIYADELYLLNNSVKVGEEVQASFDVYNDFSFENSFSYSIQIDADNSISYKIKNMKPYSKRTVYVSWKYDSIGTYTPVLAIDSKKEINEDDEGDNIKYFPKIEVKG